MTDIEDIRRYERKSPKEGSRYPLDRIIIKKMGSSIVGMALNIEAPLAPVTDINEYRKRRREERWKTS